MHKNRTSKLLRSTSLAAMVTLLGAAPAFAGDGLPKAGTVVAGAATISQPGKSTLLITQSSSNAVINWNSFNIGQGNSVTFAQPDANSATLNRVTGSATSSIAGTITANGSVYIVNPNGIEITSSGVVNVGKGFVASTLDIGNSDFMSGTGHFRGTGASANVVNGGTIVTGAGGYAALLGGSVSNTGLISAPLGKIGLGAGEEVTLDVNGDQFLQVILPSSATDANGQALISNSGALSADGGQVVLTAASARQAVRNVINMPGSISADSVSGHNGSIVLDGGAGGNVAVGGTLTSSSGNVTLSGANLTLSGATIDVSGANGGGTVRIGGKDTADQASSVSIDSTTTILADGLGAASGGAVTIWSTGLTGVHGLISAEGGAQGGAGGQIETSGQTMDFGGIAIKTGRGGNWLLDPTDLTIDSTAATAIDTALNAGTSVILTTAATGAPTESGVSGATGNTTGSGLGDINVTSALSWTGAAGLTLQAYNNININAAISLGTGTLNLYAGNAAMSNVTALNSGAITVNSPITISGAGAVNLKANALSSLTVDGVTTYFTAGGTSGGTSQSDLELAFGSNGYISYGATNNSGTLHINGTAYTLLYALSDSNDTAPDSGTDDIAGIDHAGDSGHYALATSLSNSLTFSSALAGAGVSTLNGGGHTFSGTFEGLGNTITNLNITDNSAYQILGLFGQSSGTIRDVNLSGGTVTSGTLTSGGSNTSSSDDSDSLGALVGLNLNGLVANSSASTSVTGTGGEFNGASDYTGGGVGGLVGANIGGNIMLSSATGTVTDPYGVIDNVGGLTGANMGNIDLEGVTALGGNSNATILYSYETGSVSTTVSAATINDVGGLVGIDAGEGSINSGTATGSANIIGSWASGNVSGSGASNSYGYNGGLAAIVVDSNYGISGSAIVADSYATGTVKDTGTDFSSGGGGDTIMDGGLVGYAFVNAPSGTVIFKNDYVTGAVTTPNTLYNPNIGGVFGDANFGDVATTLSDVYYTNGVADGATGSTSGTTTAVSAATLKGALETGLSSTIWTAGTSGVNGGFPTISANAPPLPDLTIDILGQTSTYGTAYSIGSTITTDYTEYENGSQLTGGSLISLTGFTISASGVGTATLAGTSAGSYTLDGTTPSNSGYRFTIDTGTLTVGKASLTITPLGQTSTYGTAYSLQTGVGTGYSETGLVNSDAISGLTLATTGTGTASGSLATTNAGAYAITGSAATGTGLSNYTISYATGADLTVGKASLTITPLGQTSTYGTAYSLQTGVGTGYSETGLVNSDAISGLTLATTGTGTASGSLATTNAGAYAITGSAATGTGLSNYNISYATGADLTVGKASLTITATDQTMTYGGTMPSLTLGYGGFVNGQNAADLTTAPTVASGTLASANAGTYTGTLVASGGVSSNYSFTYVAGTLTIGKANLTITPDNQSMTYGGTMPTLTAGYIGLVNGDTASSLTTAPTLVSGTLASANAGTYTGTLTASGAVDSNYTISYGTGTLTIGKANLTITPDNQSMTYGGAVPTLTAGYIGLVNGDTASSLTTAPSLATTGTATSNVGAYAITASGAVGGNYNIAYAAGTLNIGQADLTVTPTSQTKTYGQTLVLNAGDFTQTGLVNGDQITGLTLASAGTGAAANAGAYDITASNATGTGLANYAISYVIGTKDLTVNPASITVSANSGTSVYGTTPVNPGLSATGLQNGETVAVLTGLSNSFGVTAASDVGSGPYVLTVAGALSNPNYTVTQRMTGTWVVTPATLTYVADPGSRMSGVTNPAFSGGVTGFVLSDTLASATTGTMVFSSSASPSAAPGEYAITGSGLTADNGNYAFIQAPGNATALTVTSGLTSLPSRVTPQFVLSTSPWNVVLTVGPGYVEGLDLWVDLSSKTLPQGFAAATCLAPGEGHPAICTRR